MRNKLKVAIAAVVLTSVPLVAAPRAEAMTCARDIEDACRIVFTVVCDVVAKGRACVA